MNNGAICHLNLSETWQNIMNTNRIVANSAEGNTSYNVK